MSKRHLNCPRIVAIIISFGLVSACEDECENTILQSSESPDGHSRSVLFERSCGATTGFSTQISILKDGETLRGSGNIFAVDDNRGSAKSEIWGGPWAESEWISNDTLIVSYDANSRVFKTEKQKLGVKVIFEAVSHPARE